MGLTKGQRVDYASLEARRLQAARLFEQGLSQAAVSRKLGVKPASVCRWHRAWESGGKQALRRKGGAGRKARITAAQLRQLENALLKGPLAHGYHSELWTLERIGELIQRKFGIRYYRGHVWKLLQRMEWSAQRPALRAKERDEGAIGEWRKKRWPAKKGRYSAKNVDCPHR